jgi:hypothetical protein
MHISLIERTLLNSLLKERYLIGLLKELMSGSSVGGGVTSTQATNRTSNEAITTMALYNCATVRRVR